MYALCKHRWCKLVPCGQVYKVNAVVIDYLLESVTTVYNLNSKGHQILCICLCVESQSRSSSSPDEEDIIISDTTVPKLPGTRTYNILVCWGKLKKVQGWARTRIRKFILS